MIPKDFKCELCGTAAGGDIWEEDGHFYHAVCRLRATLDQRDLLLEAAIEMLAMFLDDAEPRSLHAMERRMNREAAAVSELQAAIAACKEVPNERQQKET